MRTLLRWLGGILSLIANLLAVVGANQQMGDTEGWLGVIHQWMGNPLLYFPISIGASLLLALVLADYFLERKLVTAGGITKRELPARFANWDRVPDLTLRQVAWLWTELEPLNDDITGTAAHPALRRLEADQEKNKLPKRRWRDSESGSAKVDRLRDSLWRAP